MHANAVGRQRGIAVGIAQIDVVGADGQEAANLDGADREVAPDRVARLVDDDGGDLPSTSAGVQPDDRRHDSQEDEGEQTEPCDADPAQRTSPTPH